MRFGKLSGYTMNYDIQYIGTDLLMEILLIHVLAKKRKDAHKGERIARVKPIEQMKEIGNYFVNEIKAGLRLMIQRQIMTENALRSHENSDALDLTV